MVFETITLLLVGLDINKNRKNMSIAKRDTDQCVFIRFQVNESRIEVFRNKFVNTTKIDFYNSLKGLSRDSGNAYLTFSFTSSGSSDTAKRAFATSLNTVFAKLFDYYPSISEKPSDLQAATALSFIRENTTIPAVSVTEFQTHALI